MLICWFFLSSLTAPRLFCHPSGDTALLVLLTGTIQGSTFHWDCGLHSGHGMHGRSRCPRWETARSRWVGMDVFYVQRNHWPEHVRLGQKNNNNKKGKLARNPVPSWIQSTAPLKVASLSEGTKNKNGEVSTAANELHGHCVCNAGCPLCRLEWQAKYL